MSKSNTNLAPVNGAAAANIVAARLSVPAATLAEVGVDAGTWMVLCDSIFPAAKTPEGIALAVRYCKARGLDVMKRPVHVVPMWSKALNREVETVWPGIAEVQITASRTGLWAGMDPPRFGPDKSRVFRGTIYVDGRGQQGQVEVTYPEWVEVTVYRIVGGVRAAFSETVFWEESYGRASRGGEVPNDMWQKRPRGQLLKCGKAASLRAAFPEEAGYTAEEMAGRQIEGDIPVVAAGNGVVIDVKPTETVSASVPDSQTSAATGADHGQTDAKAEEIEASVREQVAKLVFRTNAMGAWTQAEEWAHKKFTGAHLHYCLTELAKAKARAQTQAENDDPARAALDAARAAAAA